MNQSIEENVAQFAAVVDGVISLDGGTGFLVHFTLPTGVKRCASFVRYSEKVVVNCDLEESLHFINARAACEYYRRLVF